MNNKFENEIEEEKLLKKRLLDRISVSLLAIDNKSLVFVFI